MPLRQIEFIIPQANIETVLRELEENKDNEVRYSIKLENNMASEPFAKEIKRHNILKKAIK